MEYLRLRSGSTSVIRPVGPAILLHRVYDTTASPPVSTAYSEEEKVAGVEVADPRMLKMRTAMAVIDMTDKQVKLMEYPLAVARPIRDFVINDPEVQHPGDINGILLRVTVEGHGLMTQYNPRIERHRLTDDLLKIAMEQRLDPYMLVTSFSKQVSKERERRLAHEDMLNIAVGRLVTEGYTVTPPPKKAVKKCRECRGLGWVSLMDRCHKCNPEPYWVKELGEWRLGKRMLAAA